jgi:N-acylglucosamine 2-epimerase
MMNLPNLSTYYRDTLLNDVIPFWLAHGADPERGGIMTCLDRQGRVIDTDKGVWQQGRFAWMLAHLYNTVDRRPEWLAHAEHTARFMIDHCFDADGRMFFHVTRDGLPIRKRRYAFSESFASIAFGELARATGKAEYADLALKTYSVFAGHVPEPKFAGTRPLKALGKPMIDIVTCQCLRESIGYREADDRIDAAIAEIRRDFMKPELRCCMENVGPGGEVVDHLDGRLLNPGHALEGAWFIMLEGQRRGRADYVRSGLDVLDWMWARGWDEEYGGILYFRDLYGHPVSEYWQDMKFWWPQNEALIATLLAFQLTGDEKYAGWHAQLHAWYARHFVDAEFGDCYGYLSRDCRVTSPVKGNLFKGCFHYPRQLLTCWQLLRKV